MLVLVLMVVTFCQDCGKPTWASFHAGKSIGSVTFFWMCCAFCNHQNFPDFGPRIWKCFPPRIWCSATAKHRLNCCQSTSLCLWLFVVTVGDVTTILGLFLLSLNQKPCNNCGEKTLCLLCSEVYRRCNQVSLSIKNGAQIRIV